MSANSFDLSTSIVSFVEKLLGVLNGASGALLGYKVTNHSQIQNLSNFLDKEVYYGPPVRTIKIQQKESEGRIEPENETVVLFYSLDTDQEDVVYWFDVKPLPLGKLAVFRRALPAQAQSLPPFFFLDSFQTLRYEDLQKRIGEIFCADTGCVRVASVSFADHSFEVGTSLTGVRSVLGDETLDLKHPNKVVLTRHFVQRVLLANTVLWNVKMQMGTEQDGTVIPFSSVISAGQNTEDKTVSGSDHNQTALLFGVDDDGTVLGVEVTENFNLPLPKEYFPPPDPDEVKMELYLVNIWGTGIEQLAAYNDDDYDKWHEIIKSMNGRVWTGKNRDGMLQLLRVPSKNETLRKSGDKDLEPGNDKWVLVDPSEWPKDVWIKRYIVKLSMTPRDSITFLNESKAFPCNLANGSAFLSCFGAWARLRNPRVILEEHFDGKFSVKAFIGETERPAITKLGFEFLNRSNLTCGKLESLFFKYSNGRSAISVVLEKRMLLEFKRELAKTETRCREASWDIIVLLTIYDLNLVSSDESASSFHTLRALNSEFWPEFFRGVSIIDVILYPMDEAQLLGDDQGLSFDQEPPPLSHDLKNDDISQAGKCFFEGTLDHHHWLLFQKSEIPIWTKQMEIEMWMPLNAFFDCKLESTSHFLLMDVYSTFAKVGVTTSLKLMAVKLQRFTTQIVRWYRNERRRVILDSLKTNSGDCVIIADGDDTLTEEDISEFLRAREQSGSRLCIVRGWTSGMKLRVPRTRDRIRINLSPRWDDKDLVRLSVSLNKTFGPDDKLAVYLQQTQQYVKNHDLYRHFFTFIFIGMRGKFRPVENFIADARNAAARLGNALHDPMLSPTNVLDSLACVSGMCPHRLGLPLTSFSKPFFNPLFDDKDVNCVLIVRIVNGVRIGCFVHPFFARLHLVQEYNRRGADILGLPFPPPSWLLENMRSRWFKVINMFTLEDTSRRKALLHSMFIQNERLTPLAAHCIVKGNPKEFHEMCKSAETLEAVEMLIVASKVYRCAKGSLVQRASWCSESIKLAKEAIKQLKGNERYDRLGHMALSNLATCQIASLAFCRGDMKLIAQNAEDLLEECYQNAADTTTKQILVQQFKRLKDVAKKSLGGAPSLRTIWNEREKELLRDSEKLYGDDSDASEDDFKGRNLYKLCWE